MFQISMGVPKMAAIWDELKQKVRNGGATKKEQQLFRKMGKAMNHLAHDPGYPELHSHEITELSDRVGFRVWQSYIENNTPAAGRIYRAYGPGKGQITIMGHSSLKSAIVSFICARFIPIYRRMSFA